ncbi:MAG: MFS transporter [Erysipelotrichia bacterium]|nr:MFS transporter [Erysipelotrichia bacterium]
MIKKILSYFAQGSYRFANGFVSAFTIVYLNRAGFYDWQIGIIISLMGLFSLILNYFITGYCLKIINNKIKYWTLFIYILSFINYGLYYLSSDTIAKMVFFPLGYAFFSYNHHFVNLLCAANNNDDKVKDGNRPTNIGTLVYGLTVGAIGSVFDKYHNAFLIKATFIVIGIAFLSALLLENKQCFLVDKLNIKRILGIIGDIKENRTIILFLIAVTASSVSAVMSLKFLSRIVVENGGSAFNLGIAFMIQSLVVIPVSYYSDKIRKVYDADKVLLFNFAFSLLKIIILWRSKFCWQIYLAMLLTAFGYGGMGFACVDYLKRVAGDRYEIFHELTTLCDSINLGSLFGGVISGIIMTFCTVRILLLISWIVALLGLIVLFLSQVNYLKYK